MSFSSLRLSGLALVAALSACTVAPLHGPAAVDPASGQPLGLQSLAGRVAVVQADTRTDQIVRNRLLFRLNGGSSVREPLYELGLAVSASDQGVSIESGTGVPTASVYRIQATYTLYRMPDRAVLATGTRTVTAPYDRSDQLFAAQRALIDARENAGQTLADQIAVAVGPALRDELTPGRSPAVAAALPR